MTYIASEFHHPGLPKKRSRLHPPRLRKARYRTLCAGCGHDRSGIRSSRPAFELSIEPHRVSKISASAALEDPGLLPRQFARLQFGARPDASVLTGANLANRELIYLGVSGDGESASIGFGPVRAFDPRAASTWPILSRTTASTA